MKELINKADQLLETIDMGLLSEEVAFSEIRVLRNEIENAYDEGSDEFMICIYPLIDANEVAMRLYND